MQKIVELTRQKAELWGYQESPYDALIDDYEPGITARRAQTGFGRIARWPWWNFLARSPNNSVPESFLDGHYPIDGQQAFSVKIATAFGYDFTAGRVDTTMHPFATTLGPFDQRITTRYNTQPLRGFLVRSDA